MKRTLVLLGTFGLCGVLSGCASDPQGDAISNVIQKMNDATGDIESIAKEVDSAVKKQEKEQKAIDFAEAIKMAKNLEKTGKELQKLKVEQITNLKPPDEEAKKEHAQQFRSRINVAFNSLLQSKAKLNEALQKASANPDNKEKVDDLRTKIREAEGPFETIARQG
jgi:hypothetical protein